MSYLEQVLLPAVLAELARLGSPLAVTVAEALGTSVPAPQTPRLTDAEVDQFGG